MKAQLALQVTDFQGLLAIRAGLAAAQATQNPICFSLIPEMFPRRRNLAMSAYNSAIYAGRALSYAAVLIAARLSESTRAGDSGVMMVNPAYGAPGPASHLPLMVTSQDPCRWCVSWLIHELCCVDSLGSAGYIPMPMPAAWHTKDTVLHSSQQRHSHALVTKS